MSAYRFMAGIVDTITGGEDDENYDPHQHRKIEKPTSYIDTMTHLLKGSIGAGIMAMAGAFYRVGLIYGIVLIVLIGSFATYCIQLLIATQYQLCKKWRCGYIGYPKSIKLAIQDGPPCCRWSANLLRHAVESVLVIWQIGICSIYIIFFAENVKQVCDFYEYVQPTRMHIGYQLVPQLFLNLIKTLKLLSPLSTLSNMLTMLSFLLVFFYLIEDDLELDDDKLALKDFEGIPIFIGITLFALEAVGLVLALEYNMENPKQFVGLCGLFNIGMVIIIILYGLIGIFGYMKYGNAINASITLNLPQDQKKAQVAKVMLAVAIFLSFPLQNFVAYNILWHKIEKRNHQKGSALDYALRMLLVLIPWSLSLAMPYLGPFISLFGAFCLSLLAIIFPGIMSVCYRYPNRYGRCRYKLIRDYFIVIMGIAILVAGCFTSVKDIYEAMF